jgi:hypothetical protein
MSKTHTPFPEISGVTKKDRSNLHASGLLKPTGEVLNWVPLAPHLIDRTLSKHNAQLLVLIELEWERPRLDIIKRLVSYISYSEKERTMEEIHKLL